MSEGFTVRGFLVAADNKTRRVRLRFSEADWVDFLDEQFPLGGEVYISAKNTAADIAAAEERGRREGIESLRKKMTYDETASKGSWGWGLITRTYSIDADIFDALLEKEADK
jgi:hypothetical protein